MSPAAAAENGSNGEHPGSGAVGTASMQLSLPPTSTLVDPAGSYLVVSWDLDTTGRRLLDEICQIGGYFRSPCPHDTDTPKDKEATDETSSPFLFSQYVMPYKNPNPGARRSFGIRVVNIGRYRMLKDMETGKILKTKSEVSALQEFIAWLKSSAAKYEKKFVLLACHEPTRKVLVPLLLEALTKYHLMEEFGGVVKGFVNGVHAVAKFGGDGDAAKITSLSLRSLCKTVLNDTNPNTNSASDRSKVLADILAKLSPDMADLSSVAVTVSSEEEELRKLKGVLGTQGTLRPIFESQLRQKRSVREKAMGIRKKLAESGLDYKTLAGLYADNGDGGEEATKRTLVKRVNGLGDGEVDELVQLLKAHFGSSQTKEEKNQSDNVKVEG